MHKCIKILLNFFYAENPGKMCNNHKINCKQYAYKSKGVKPKAFNKIKLNKLVHAPCAAAAETGQTQLP